MSVVCKKKAQCKNVSKKSKKLLTLLVNFDILLMHCLKVVQNDL